jgi:ABC-type nickel/cobalt efflux system permease component RcnA
MSTTVVTALVTAGVLGVTHALEPDHIAGISSLTSEYGDSRLSALVGACFSLGHVLLVVGWLVVASLLLRRTAFPQVFDAVGTLVVGVLLGLLGTVMAVTGLQRVVRTEEHDHGQTTHSHPHVHLPMPGFDGHDHDHGTVAYLKTGVVGALFTLSPPVSMIVFASTLLPDYGPGVLTLAVGTYGVAITATMSLLGAGVGRLFGLTRTRSARLHGTLQSVAGVAIAVLAVILLLDATPLPF